MWDIAGKAYGVPIAQLLGGKYRDKVRIYADLHAGDSRAPADWADTARQAVDEGYTAIKFDVDSFVHGFTGGGWEERKAVTNPELYEMVEQIGAVRQAVGSGVDIAVDCHWSFSVVDAIRIGRALAQFDLLFFEDPVQLGDYSGLKAVTDSVPCPVGYGEKQHTTMTWVQLLETRAINVALPDFMDGGGIAYGRDLAHMCEIRSIPLCPHNFSDAIGTLAIAHVSAAIPNFIAMEFHFRDEPHWAGMIAGDWPVIEDGYIAIPDRPGLGIEVDWEFARRNSIAASEGFFVST
jgi:L-alanine-DL-glutamate epimerase-like enolase superfamily enzyme